MTPSYQRETAQIGVVGSPKLSPCPFCGGEANADGVARFSKNHEAWWADQTRVLEAFFVSCMRCGVNNQNLVGGHQTREIAIAKWNARPSGRESRNNKGSKA